MSEKNEPAFPTPDIYFPNGQIQYGGNGMTLRDWFAATIQLSPLDIERINDIRSTMNSNFDAESAVRYEKADAMLAARSAGEGE